MGGPAYVLRKVLYALLTLLFVLIFNFALFRVLPSDPVELVARSLRLTEVAQQDLKRELGLCVPPAGESKCSVVGRLSTLPTYLRGTITGNLGRSFVSSNTVVAEIRSRLWPTVLLVGAGTAVAVALGVFIGIKGAWRRGTAFDTTSLFSSLVFYSTPEGWLGMMLLIVFAGTLGWFPSGGYQSSADLSGPAHVVDVARHLFLPMMTLVLGYVGEYVIIMRASLLEVVNEDFVKTARAKGVPDRLVRRRHAVPNAILPTFTLVILSFGYVLGGAVIIEGVFSWPGIGLLTYEAVEALDYPVIQGIFLFAAMAMILFNLVGDIVYGYLDPRIRQA
ncbi:MAG TPA: ABC transporter permease [Actinomycetota bacterium]|nr:ABC transporter permease [Actinomycetota bacterium]